MSKTYKHNLAFRINNLREQHGYSLRHLAGLIGVSHNTIKKWCDGETIPTRAHLKRLGEVFKISPATLAFGIGSKDNDANRIADVYSSLNETNQKLLMDLALSLLLNDEKELKVSNHGKEIVNGDKS